MLRGVYGLHLERPPFVGRPPQEQVALLKEWGVNAVFGGYDAPAFAQAARAAGIALYAEFRCFAGAEWWQRLPESIPCDATGTRLTPEEGYYGVNPSHPTVRKERLEALETLLKRYSLDGVWLDFIRWPCHWEVPQPRCVETSFDSGTVQRFAQDRGIALEIGSPAENAKRLRASYWEDWLAWRCEQIVTWVAQAREIANALQPQAHLGLFAVPWRRGEFQDAIFRIIGQDHTALARYVDIFSPMTYHAMCGRSTEWIAQIVQDLAERTDKPIWPVVQSVDHPRPLGIQEYAQALDYALRASGSIGALVFTLEGMLTPTKLAVTREAFLSV